jgi:hypothetical protein
VEGGEDMPRTYIPVRKHLDRMVELSAAEVERRRAYQYKGVVASEVWGLKYKVGQEVIDGESGERVTIVGASNQQVVQVHGS